uniref:Uncharacterized protein n=1 Tax=Rhizophora mucronata TaxID=61149 RepID=A0A2P2NY90_RHIMU
MGLQKNKQKKKKQTLGSINALFGRSSSWRTRTWRKFMSFVLLNLITMVYASNIPVVKEVEALVDSVAFTVVWSAVCAIPFILFVF